MWVSQRKIHPITRRVSKKFRISSCSPQELYRDGKNPMVKKTPRWKVKKQQKFTKFKIRVIKENDVRETSTLGIKLNVIRKDWPNGKVF